MRISKAINRSFAPRIEHVFHILCLVLFLQFHASVGLTAPMGSHQLPKIENCLAHNTLVVCNSFNRFEAKRCLKDGLRVSWRKSIVLNVRVWVSRCIIISIN